MVFDKNYDNTLWLVLMGDKNNRDVIMEFIKSIPANFLYTIQNTLLEYNRYLLENENVPVKDRSYRAFNGDIYGSDGYLYSFNIDISSNTLSLFRNAYRYGLYFNDFELVLFPYNMISQLVDFSKCMIAELNYDYDQINTGSQVLLGDCTNVYYNLVKLPFGSVLSSLNNDLFLFKKRISLVDTENIPVDYNVSDMNNDRINKLVKSKKKKSI